MRELSDESVQLAEAVKDAMVALRTLVNNNQINNNLLSTTDKSNLVGAVNELKASIDALSYNDLDDLPSLFSGSYADLSGTPTIPSTVIELSDVTTYDFATLNTPLADALAGKATAAQGALADTAVQEGDSPSFVDVDATGTVTAAGGAFSGPVSINGVITSGGTTLGQINLLNSAGALRAVFKNTGSVIGISSETWQPLTFSVNSAERMRITATGDVGIGTASPSAKLHVMDGAITVPSVSATTMGIFATNGATRVSIIGNAGTIQSLAFGDDSSEADGKIEYANGGRRMSFYTAATEKMIITSSGDVGIGTTTPAEKLDVGGNITASGTVTAGSSVIIGQHATASLNASLARNGSGRVLLNSSNNAGADCYGTFLGRSHGEFLGNLTASGTVTAAGATFNGLVSQTGLGRSTYFGEDAGIADDLSSNNNVGIGFEALKSNTTGASNTASGYQALKSNTTGAGNTASGYGSLPANTIGSYNTASGYACLLANTIGSYNTASGYASLRFNTTGSNNTASGYFAGRYIADGTTENETSGTSVYLGAGTKALANGDANEIVIGYNAIGAGSNSVVLGNSSITTTVLRGDVETNGTVTAAGATFNGLVSQTGLGGSTYFGESAGIADDLSSNNNVGIGFEALKANTSGASNTASGYQALRSNTTGSFNAAIGYQSLYFNTTGSSNTASGTWALYNNITGGSNTASGTWALYNNTTGPRNTAIGYLSLFSNTSGYDNTASGNAAGRYIADGTTANQTSNTSIYLGANTKALADGDANEIVIGFNAIGAGSNTATLGNTLITKTVLRGDVETDGTVKTGSYTVGTLPPPSTGMRAYVTDSNRSANGHFGSAVIAAGVGATEYIVPVFYDGTDWIIA